jgi:hypothetical protein
VFVSKLTSDLEGGNRFVCEAHAFAGVYSHQGSIASLEISSSVYDLFLRHSSVDFTHYCGYFTRAKNSRRVRSLLALVVFEEFHLAQALLGLFARLVRAAQIFALLLGNHFIAGFYFFDHALPSCASFPLPNSGVNTMPAVALLASGGFLRYVLTRQGGEQ